ncbi:hypothetical protein FRB91_005296 [Serendipita sp. 411]|nr:hypothetical protein FRB91_005296 [Serendipita sp. 411]
MAIFDYLESSSLVLIFINTDPEKQDKDKSVSYFLFSDFPFDDISSYGLPLRRALHLLPSCIPSSLRPRHTGDSKRIVPSSSRTRSTENKDIDTFFSLEKFSNNIHLFPSVRKVEWLNPGLKLVNSTLVSYLSRIVSQTQALAELAMPTFSDLLSLHDMKLSDPKALRKLTVSGWSPKLTASDCYHSIVGHPESLASLVRTVAT